MSSTSEGHQGVTPVCLHDVRREHNTHSPRQAALTGLIVRPIGPTSTRCWTGPICASPRAAQI